MVGVTTALRKNIYVGLVILTILKVGYVVGLYIGDSMGSKNIEKCPECNMGLIHAGGCAECPNCGWGACT